MLNTHSLTEVQNILSPPRINALASAIRNALNVWNNSLSSAQMVLDGLGRAIIINQYWYHFANLALDDDAGVIAGIEQRQRFLAIDERILLRFELLDDNFESKNYPTKRATLFRLQIPLMGLPPIERLEVGYRLDLTGTVIRDAFVLLRVGKQIPWLWQIGGNEISTFPVNFELRPEGAPEPYVFAYDNLV